MRPVVFLPLFLLVVNTWVEAAQEVPFRLVNGFLLVSGTVEGRSEPLTLLVDSGASTSVLDLKTARRLRIALGQREAVRGVDSEAAAFRVHGVGLALNGHGVDFASLALDLSTALTLCGERVDGLIGAGFFAERVVQIDYPARKIRLLESANDSRPEAIRLPVRRENGVFCAPVGLNGSRDRWLRVDTGCNDSLHWVVAQGKEKRRRGATIGFVDDEQNITRATVRLGRREVRNVETSLHGRAMFPGEAGLLGNGLLGRYVVTLDGPGGALWLQ
jgi:hypothetical protein